MLQGKEVIEAFSFEPEKVRELEQAGVEIIDIVTAGRLSQELRSWADWFREKGIPCFGVKMDRARGQVKLYIERTIDHDGQPCMKKAPV